ncbi:hypothetical protein [Streptomyces chryseus]
MDDAMSDAMALLDEVFPAEVRRRPLGWEQLRGWEVRQGVVLPEPYRTFVAEMANGTDEGPTDGGGLLPLGAKPDSWFSWRAECWLSPQPFDGTAVRRPDRPFPLTEEWEWEYDYLTTPSTRRRCTGSTSTARCCWAAANRLAFGRWS